ncbi:MAG: C26 family cysteine hydrolase domain-containing family [Bacilli bacterium]|nr:C26 family cysteine hydrolase domain-containing family [Bacilli bacterium]
MYKIGVLARPDKLPSGNLAWVMNEMIRDVIIRYESDPVIIVPLYTNYQKPCTNKGKLKLEQYLFACDGVILPGGDHPYDYDIVAVKYLYEHDIPTFGICLGMQSMALAFDGEITYEALMGYQHNQKGKDYIHLVEIVPDSVLDEMLHTNQIKVNSSHQDCIAKTDLTVCAISPDGVIEAVAAPQKQFFLGVQWHPEAMIEYDMVSNQLFDAFFKAVGRYYEIKQHHRSDQGKP